MCKCPDVPLQDVLLLWTCQLRTSQPWILASRVCHISHVLQFTIGQHSSSSCKGTSGLLRIMGLNTMIFAVLKAWLMSPLHYVNWKVFYIDFFRKRWQIRRWGQWKSNRKPPHGLSIGTMIFDLEWPWTVIIQGHGILASNISNKVRDTTSDTMRSDSKQSTDFWLGQWSLTLDDFELT